MYFLLLFLFLSVETRVCNISVPIGSWLKNNTGPCDEINGHFILDSTANNFTKKLFSAFSQLTRINGCIKIKGFTGLKNFSFFSILEEVICEQKKAKEAKLKNVIEVNVAYFEKLGFGSLKTVKGPGEIRIILTFPVEGVFSETPCFSKEELIFLAYHPQFKGELYLPCRTSNDACFRLDQRKPDYRFIDIPHNCTEFFGTVSIIGGNDEEQLLGRFENLKLIIGQLHIGATLLDRLDRVFPKLEIVYPYYFTVDYTDGTLMPRDKFGDNVSHYDLNGKDLGINDEDLRYNFQSVQYVHARINRFLTNMSIPTLLNIRPLDVGSDKGTDLEYKFFFSSQLSYTVQSHINSFLPVTIDDPCVFYSQFNGTCGVFLARGSSSLGMYRGKCYQPAAWTIEPDDCIAFLFNFETWLLSIVSVAVGFLFSFRAMVLLLFSKANKSLSHLRILLFVLILLSTVTALENSIIYQKAIKFLGPTVHFLPQFESLYLLHPAAQWILGFLAACRHSCLAVIVLCYVDIVICSMSKIGRLSAYFPILVLMCFPILTAYLNSQIYLAIRGIRPIYSRQPRQLLFIPFVMNTIFKQTFINLSPETMMLIYNSDDQLFSATSAYKDDSGSATFFPPDVNVHLVDFPLEPFGQAFPDFSRICDIGMVIAVCLFYFLRHLKFINFHGRSEILILLYLQTSINRIRFFLHSIIFVNDFCRYTDYDHGQWYMTRDIGSPPVRMCYDVGYMLVWGDDFTPETRVLPTYMTQFQWELTERFFEMLPYIFCPVVSYFCYKFTREHCYLGAAIELREKKEAAVKVLVSQLKDPSDVGDV